MRYANCETEVRLFGGVCPYHMPPNNCAVTVYMLAPSKYSAASCGPTERRTEMDRRRDPSGAQLEGISGRRFCSEEGGKSGDRDNPAA